MRRSHVSIGTAVVAAALMIASADGVRAGPRAAGTASDGAFFVRSVTPERNRSMLPDLSDPGANGRITVRFSARVRALDVLDDQNLVNGLSSKCDFRDPSFAAVPATATLRGNVLSIDPFDDSRHVLPPGRYTLTLKSSIRSTQGHLLNGGADDSRTSFLIGADIYAPVLHSVSPSSGATGVGLRRAIVATFDEPIDGLSAAMAIRVEDRSTVPATPVSAHVRLARGGLDVVVRPAVRYPRDAELTLVIPGRGTATDPSSAILTDRAGNEFTRDEGPQWVADPSIPDLFHSPVGDFDDATGEFTMTFRTKAAARASGR